MRDHRPAKAGKCPTCGQPLHPKSGGKLVCSGHCPDPVVSPADTPAPEPAVIMDYIASLPVPGKVSEYRKRAEAMKALSALLAVGERDKAEIEALRVCPAGTGCALNSGAVHCYHCRRNYPPDETWEQPFLARPNLQRREIQTLHGILDERLAAWERDRRHIAQLTELFEAAQVVADLNGERRSTYGREVTNAEFNNAMFYLETAVSCARAVLAGEEDARP